MAALTAEICRSVSALVNRSRCRATNDSMSDIRDEFLKNIYISYFSLSLSRSFFVFRCRRRERADSAGTAHGLIGFGTSDLYHGASEVR